MEMPGKVAMEAATADESTESVVLQWSSSGDVEDGEEVVRAEPASESLPTSTRGQQQQQQQQSKRGTVKVMASSRGREWDDDVVVRSSGELRAWLTDDAAYWNTGGRVRTRRSKETKGHVEDVGGTVEEVEKTHVKRKLEESQECDRLSESELDEGTESDDAESSSSSDSDASESDSEEISWRANKRRRAGEEVHLKSRRGRPGVRAQDETTNFDNELKEMQLLLELQLKASERREAGMKQRMETMMALMSKHMGHVEKRVSSLEEQPQEQILERINVKLEKVMEGFTTLNENLSILYACLSRDFETSQ